MRHRSSVVIGAVTVALIVSAVACGVGGPSGGLKADEEVFRVESGDASMGPCFISVYGDGRVKGCEGRPYEPQKSRISRAELDRLVEMVTPDFTEWETCTYDFPTCVKPYYCACLTIRLHGRSASVLYMRFDQRFPGPQPNGTAASIAGRILELVR